MGINTKSRQYKSEIDKSLTGIQGLDEITDGGLPSGRPTLICGSPGCGKTMFAMEFLYYGAENDEPGIFVSFEERPEELVKNFASLGMDLNKLVEEKKFDFEYIYIERSEIEETGEYDLEGLFIRLEYAVNQIGAKRIVLDTVEALFSGLTEETILRAELRRLFSWLKEKGLTAIITGERGEKTLTRYGLEEYVADCVILLDNPVIDNIATRSIRIIKYRGSSHGSNSYPFLIDEDGISIVPVTSAGLDHPASKDYVSSGISRLDSMLDGKGFYRGSSILVSGSAGTGKSSIAAQFVNAACARGERCVYLAFEESPKQIIRNMRSIGIDLGKWVDRGLLSFRASRPTLYGLEMHLVNIYKVINEFNPDILVFDPISNLITIGTPDEVKSMLIRLIDHLKGEGITTMSTSLSEMSKIETDVGVSSLMDTWIDLKAVEFNGERNRTLDILKSRGMNHSNQLREFLLTDNGIELVDVYLGPAGMLTGSARISQIALESAQKLEKEQEIERKTKEIERKREILKSKINELKCQYEAEEENLKNVIDEEKLKAEVLKHDRDEMAKLRKADKN